MKLAVKFAENDKLFKAQFGEVNNISDGGYERGYDAGYEVGNTDGYTKGHTDGVKQGYASGYEQGRADFELDSQEKTVTITENGSVEILPDDGCVLSKVVANVDVASDLDQNLNGTLTTINSNITSLRAYGCYSLTSLRTVNFPNVTSIPTNAFRACTQLREVNAPKATTIGSYAFYTCSQLKKVDFPLLSYIDQQAFSISAAFDTLVLRSSTVATLANTNAFTNTPISKGTGYIYVPDDLVDSYKSAANWSTYASQIKPISELKE